MKRVKKIIYISDGTGITAKTLGNSLLSQFKDFEFHFELHPYIDSIDKAQNLKTELEIRHQDEKIIIFSSLVRKELREIFKTPAFYFFDLFEQFIPGLSECLNCEPSFIERQVHSMHDAKQYTARIDAMNYALNCDDGLGHKHYDQANVILIGVSRSGKTPTSLYLALNFGVLCANYPLTEENFKSLDLPKTLEGFKKKLFGLTISPKRLSNIRQARRSKSHYADLAQCEKEIAIANNLFTKFNIPSLDTTERSIEEIATLIITSMNLQRS